MRFLLYSIHRFSFSTKKTEEINGVSYAKSIDGINYQLFHIKEDENGNRTADEVKQTKVNDDGEVIKGFEFTTDGFSSYVLKYTVDFHYEGTDYSIEGNSQILLSDLIETMQIKNGDDLLNVSDVVSVSFSDDRLVTVQQVSGLITYNDAENVDAGEKDFLLTSVQPFTSEEKMLIILNNGDEINLAVTDEQPYALPLYGYNFGGLYGCTGLSDSIIIGYPADVAANLTFDTLSELSALPFTYASSGFNVENIGLIETDRNAYVTKKYQVIGFALADSTALSAMTPETYKNTYVS